MASNLMRNRRKILLMNQSQQEIPPENLFWNEIVNLTQQGLASTTLEIGQQLDTTWQQYANDTVYNMPMNVVSFEELSNNTPAVWLQSHWLVSSIQFDASEAIWYCSEELPAGKYKFTFGISWGSYVEENVTYSFTLTHPIPIGGQIVIGTTSDFYTWGAPNIESSSWRIYTFSEATSITPIEVVEIRNINEGENLGILTNDTKYGSTGLNNIQRAAYGYNRWSQSAIRQWLNSDAIDGGWWSPQNVYDRPPKNFNTRRGFLACIPQDFRSVIKTIPVTTALNTRTDNNIGVNEITNDKFFLASYEQEYISPNIEGEGTYWPYWQERLGLTTPRAIGSGRNEDHQSASIKNHSSVLATRLRSVSRTSAYNVGFISTTGNPSSNYATNEYAFAPCCVIY